MEIKVSVIVAMYNSEKYLDKCIMSLLAQTLDDFEIILVNDCSPDHSLEIAQKYSNAYPEKVKVINHTVNLRAGGARNNGLRNSRGKYVWFVDADDWLAPTALEEAYSLAEKNNCDVVSVDYYEIISDDADPISLQEAVPDSCAGKMDIEKQNRYIADCKGGFSKLIRRDFLEQNKLYYPEGIRYEDNGIVPLIGAVATEIATIHKGLYYYRVGNPDSQTHTVQSEMVIQDRLKAMVYFYEKASALGILQDLHTGVEYFFVKIYYVSNVSSFIRGRCALSNELFSQMKSETYKRFPNFKKNEYIVERFPFLYKLSIYAAERGFYFVKLLKMLCSLYQGVKQSRSKNILAKDR